MKKLLALAITILMSLSANAQHEQINPVEVDVVKQINELTKQSRENERKIKALLDNNPEIKELLRAFSNYEKKEETKSKKGLPLTEAYFEMEGEQLKKVLSSKNLEGITDLYWYIINSQYARDIGDIVIDQIEKARNDLEKEIIKISDVRKK